MSSAAPFPIVDGNYRMESEPIVRIGVVLAEDDKEQLEFQVPGPGYRIKLGEYEEYVDLSPNTPLTVEVNAEWLTLGDMVPFAPGTPRHFLRLLPPPEADYSKPGDGVLVRGIVAGRGFHWHKLIDQTLSHVLEFRAENGKIVLVNELPIETYLIGVITGEMSSECPIEFMKAQAVAARSWLLGQPRAPHPGKSYLWCNDDCCQRYQGTGGWSERAVNAIEECRGEVLITASRHYCDARYSKSTGGVSEDADFIWNEEIEGLTARLDAPEDSYAAKFYPVTEENLEEYIRGEWLKDCDCYASPNVVPEDTISKYLGRVDEVGQYFRWTKTLGQDDLRESLTKRGGIEDLETVMEIIPGKRGKSGRLGSMTVVYRATNGEVREREIATEYNIRAAMSMRFLYSGAFIIEQDRDETGALTEARLYGAGWGHGAGLCQIGGLGRALKGQDYKTILMAYYTDVKLERIYD